MTTLIHRRLRRLVAAQIAVAVMVLPLAGTAEACPTNTESQSVIQLPIEIGSRIRVTSSRGSYHIGRLTGMNGSKILIRRKGDRSPVELDRKELLKVEVSRGKGHRRITGLVLGAAAGAALGGMAGHASGSGSSSFDSYDPSAKEAAQLLGVVGGLLGLVIGAPGEDWDEIRIDEGREPVSRLTNVEVSPVQNSPTGATRAVFQPK